MQGTMAKYAEQQTHSCFAQCRPRLTPYRLGNLISAMNFVMHRMPCTSESHQTANSRASEAIALTQLFDSMASAYQAQTLCVTFKTEDGIRRAF